MPFWRQIRSKSTSVGAELNRPVNLMKWHTEGKIDPLISREVGLEDSAGGDRVPCDARHLGEGRRTPAVADGASVSPPAGEFGVGPVGVVVDVAVGVVGDDEAEVGDPGDVDVDGGGGRGAGEDG